MRKNLQTKLSLKLLSILFFSLFQANSQTVFDEQFDGLTMPLGWSFQSTNADPYYTWTFYDSYDDVEVAESETSPQNEWIISPSYDLSSFSNIYLIFSPWMYANRADFVSNTSGFKVLVTTNDGQTWSEIWNKNELDLTSFNGSFFYDRTISKSLQNYCGSGMTNVKIGFQFISSGVTTHYNAVYIMDVKLSTDCPVTSLKTFNSTGVSWFPIDNFSGSYEIEYGPIGFTQGTGTTVANLTNHSYTFPSSICKYDFYIRTVCSGLYGAWNNFSFQNSIQELWATNITANSALINWEGFANNYDIQYGIGNFILGQGMIINNISGANFQLNNLIENTNYKYYIRSNCNGVLGNWKSNNFNTTTLSSTNFEKTNVLISPNPTSQFLNISSQEFINAIKIIDITGRDTLINKMDNNKIDVRSLAKGVYFITIYTDHNMNTQKFIKN